MLNTESQKSKTNWKVILGGFENSHCSISYLIETIKSHYSWGRIFFFLNYSGPNLDEARGVTKLKIIEQGSAPTTKHISRILINPIDLPMSLPRWKPLNPVSAANQENTKSPSKSRPDSDSPDLPMPNLQYSALEESLGFSGGFYLVNGINWCLEPFQGPIASLESPRQRCRGNSLGTRKRNVPMFWRLPGILRARALLSRD